MGNQQSYQPDSLETQISNDYQNDISDLRTEQINFAEQDYNLDEEMMGGELARQSETGIIEDLQTEEVFLDGEDQGMENVNYAQQMMGGGQEDDLETEEVFLNGDQDIETENVDFALQMMGGGKHYDLETEEVFLDRQMAGGMDALEQEIMNDYLMSGSGGAGAGAFGVTPQFGQPDIQQPVQPLTLSNDQQRFMPSSQQQIVPSQPIMPLTQQPVMPSSVVPPQPIMPLTPLSVPSQPVAPRPEPPRPQPLMVPSETTATESTGTKVVKAQMGQEPPKKVTEDPLVVKVAPASCPKGSLSCPNNNDPVSKNKIEDYLNKGDVDLAKLEQMLIDLPSRSQLDELCDAKLSDGKTPRYQLVQSIVCQPGTNSDRFWHRRTKKHFPQNSQILYRNSLVVNFLLNAYKNMGKLDQFPDSMIKLDQQIRRNNGDLDLSGAGVTEIPWPNLLLFALPSLKHIVTRRGKFVVKETKDGKVEFKAN